MLGCRGSSSPPSNLLLITIDTLRADRLGCYGYARAATPHIDGLAENGILFEQAVAQAPVTLPSHASLLTGTYPPAHGARDNVTYRVGAESLTLAEVLKDKSFRTAAFIGAYPLHRRFGLDQGFSTYGDAVGSQQEAPSGFFAERPAEAVVDEALEEFSKLQDENFFVWVHLFDPHAPYHPPSPFKERHQDPYDGEVAYTDSEVGRLLAGLEERGLRQKTLVVLTSDHGESLGEHSERSHGFFVYDSTIRVPLILQHPSLGKPRRIADQVRSVDVMPTVLDFLGVARPKEVQGESLRPMIEGEASERPAYAESYVPLVNFRWSRLLALRHEGWKYIEAPRPELYDLTRDPEEKNNLFETEPDRARRLRGTLFMLERRFAESAAPSERRMLDERSRHALETLGYLGGGLSDDVDPSSLPDPKDRIRLWELMERELEHRVAGRFREALDIATQILEEDPENLLAIEHQGYSLYNLNRFEEAKEAFQRLIELDPKRANAHVSLGLCLEELGLGSRAREHFAQAQQLDPAYARAYARMGYALLEDGEAEGARAQLEKAIELDPESIEARTGLARLYRVKGELERAAKVYEEIWKRSPDPSVLAELAEVHLQARNLEKAGETVAAALRLDSRQWKALYVRSILHTRSGDEASAREDLEQVVALEPEFTRAYHDLAVIYAHKGEDGRAIAAYRRVLEQEPNARSFNGLGTVYARAGKWGPAIAYFEKAIELEPRYVTAYENLVEAYRAAGRPGDAELTRKKLGQMRDVPSR